MTSDQAEALQLWRENGENVPKVARLRGKGRRSTWALIQRALKAEAAGQRQSRAPEAPAAPTRIEARDAAFWRAKAQAAEKDAANLAHLLREVQGVVDQTPVPPEWLRPEARRGSRSVALLHTSDVHNGEEILPGEIEGINAFNPEICRERMKRLFQAAVEIAPRWMPDSECDGILLTMGGDLVSGDIHEELSRTNALSAHEQVLETVEIYAAGIRLLLEQYARVHVPAVPGNHGRITEKNPFKSVSRLSYDTLIAAILKREFANEPRVTFQIAEGPDARTPIYGRTVLTTHGDKLGTGGGQGFAGPILPIVRGTNKVRMQSHSAGLGCDLILGGHYHTSAAGPGFLFNGSVPGYSEFGFGIRGSVQPPMQWLARLSMAWGLCERLEVQLEPRPAKVRAKADGAHVS